MPPSGSPRRVLLALALSGLGLLVLPYLLGPYPLIVLASALSLSIACLGVNLLLGRTGLLSLGHAAFFGVGAYAGALAFTFGDLTSFELYALTGVLGSTALAAVVGAACVRATRIFFTVLTLAYAQVVHSLFVSGVILRLFGEEGHGVFYLYYGGLYIPRFTIAGTEFGPEAFGLAFYQVCVVVFVGSSLVVWRVVNSPFGLALSAIRDNDTRAEHIGLPVRWYRWSAFVLSGAITGLGGALAGQLDRQVTTQQLDWLLSARLVVACMLGGTRHFAGPIVGAFTVVALEEIARRFALYENLLLGIMLLVIVLSLPGGLTEGGRRLLAWTRRSGLLRARGG